MTRGLLIMHAAFAATLVAVSTHHFIWALRKSRLRATARFADLTVLFYGVSLLLGGILYPTYRVKVRANYFDESLPRMARLFDCKEHLAAIGFATAVGAWFLARDRDARAASPLYLPLAGITAMMACFAALVGLLTVSYRSLV